MSLHRGKVRTAHEPLRLVVEADLRGRAGESLDHPPQRLRGGRQAGRDLVGDVCVVAAEQLVAALSDSATFTEPAASSETR